MKKIIIGMLVLGITLFTACTKTNGFLGEPEVFNINNSVYSLSGVITNTTNRAVSGAIVELYVVGQTAPSYTISSDASGKYQLTSIRQGTYKIVVNASGYNTLNINLELSSTKTVNLQLLGSTSVSGKIVNSQTGLGISGVTISFTHNLNATTGTNAELQVTTDQSGNYSIANAPTGSFIGIIEAAGFFTRIVSNLTFGQGTIEITPQTIVQQPAADSYRIILTWGSTPNDLDTHFTGPTTSGSRFHIYFSNKTPSGASTNLDVDDTSSYGPETVTITTLVDGTYRYSVHNYTDKTTTGGTGIASSPAKVEVYNHSGLLQSFTAPAFTGTGNTWRVFELVASGASVTINPINTYIMATSYSDASYFVRPLVGITNDNINKEIMRFNDDEW